MTYLGETVTILLMTPGVVNVPHIGGTMVGVEVAHTNIPIGISGTGTAQTHRPLTSCSGFTNGEEIQIYWMRVSYPGRPSPDP